MNSQSSFRAIIVGGGPVGLVAAHSFLKAGIDYIVLESRDSCTPETGSSLVLNPGSLRVLDQLGLADKARESSAALNYSQVVDWEGHKYKEGLPFRAFDDALGQRPVAFHRQQLLTILYDNLPAEGKERVLLKKKVVDVESDADGVQVRCADGTSYKGSMVIGADGVHSKTRGFMRKLALASSANAKVNEEKPYTAYYRCMWGTVPRPKGRSPGDACDCHTGRGVSSMFLHGQKYSWFFIYELLDEPTQERRDYTPDDMEAYAQRVGDMHLTETLTFRDVWATHLSAGMSNLDEGILDVWSWGRVALAGDAVHKVTPNAGWGLNSGIQDVAALTNGLRGLLQQQQQEQDGGEPGVEALAAVFDEYRALRIDQMKAAFSFSAMVTRQSARSTSLAGYLYWLLETITSRIPNFDYYAIKTRGAALVSSGYVLDFVAGTEPFSGQVAWKHPIKPAVL